MKDAWDLIPDAEVIVDQMESILDASEYIEKVKNAYLVSCISVCGIRIKETSPGSETFHIVSQYFGETLRLPFFTVTFEAEDSEKHYVIALSFVAKGQIYVGFQADECSDCDDEEFCTQQIAEGPEENFSFIGEDVLRAIYFYTDQWSGHLAELASSIGLDGIRENLVLVLDQVYDTWDEIPENLESTYTLYEMNTQTGEIYKSPEYCMKDECDDSRDSGIHCYSHEDLCAVHDCFEYKEDGKYCYPHEN